MAALTTFINTNGAFSAFVARQEANARCGKLKLRDWLLTIVQRCPRYLLLLKDLMNCINVEDPEYASLLSVHTLVSKSKSLYKHPFIRSLDSFLVTTSMNASLHSHAQTLDLLALQRSTPNLPFQLVAAGRTFLKRGSLFQLEGGSFPKERDFLLFSDCLLWIANLDKGDSEAAERWEWKGVKSGLSPRPAMMRLRCRSEAELSALRSRVQIGGSGNGLLPPSQPTSPTRPSPSTPPSRSIVSPSRMKKRQGSNASCDERWWFKGKAELVDLEIIVTPPTEVGEECRLEVWSPEGSFAVYAGKSFLKLLSLHSSDFCISSQRR
jgi:FYVE/RhoGEF/PH domain-containing protein 5/6